MSQVLEATGLATAWMSEDALPKASLPPLLASVIVRAGSLTEHLRAACGKSFGVRVLRQETCDLCAFPEHLLDGRSGSGLLREVYLVSDGNPVVFAQTLVPGETLRAHPWLAGLGDEPLGQRLFCRRDLQRKPFEFARLAPGDRLALNATAGLGTALKESRDIWARRSVFLLSGHPVSVNEVFFPAALQSAII